MIMYLAALMAIILSIFGFSYSQFSTPLIQLAQVRIEGDNGILGRSSHESLEIISQNMEEANKEQECEMHDDQYRLDTRRIIEQKLLDAKQIGLAEDLCSDDLKNDAKILKDLLNKKYGFGTSRFTQNVTTLNIALEDKAKEQEAASASSTHLLHEEEISKE